MTKIILASSSPRRKEILEKYNMDFEIIKSNIQENMLKREKPETVAMSLAFQKAFDVACKVEKGNIVIGADTIVYMDKIFGKPKDEKDAFKMLLDLSDKIHYVITGISIINVAHSKKIVDYAKTTIKFRKLTEDKIRRYISTGEYKDKAGAYGIQGYGELLVEWIKGSYPNVVGLPINKLDYLLEKYFDIKLL